MPAEGENERDAPSQRLPPGRAQAEPAAEADPEKADLTVAVGIAGPLSLRTPYRPEESAPSAKGKKPEDPGSLEELRRFPVRASPCRPIAGKNP